MSTEQRISDLEGRVADLQQGLLNNAARTLRFANRMDAAELERDRYKTALEAIQKRARESWAESYEQPTPPDYYFRLNFNMGQIAGICSKALQP